MIQLIIGLLAGSLLQLVFPFLTQTIVDQGIGHRNLNFIQLILAAQLMLVISRKHNEKIQRRILLHIRTQVNEKHPNQTQKKKHNPHGSHLRYRAGHIQLENIPHFHPVQRSLYGLGKAVHAQAGRLEQEEL